MMPMGAAIGMASAASGLLNSGAAQSAISQAYASSLTNLDLQQAMHLLYGNSALQNAAPQSKAWQRNSRGETFAEWLSASEKREQELTGPMADGERLAWEVDLREWEVLRA